MAYPQVLIPPSVRPVSPMELTLQDDLTVPFQPRFARGTTQRQSWGDPVWAAQVRFEGLSGADRALLKAAVAGARGGASNILMTPGIQLRGSFPAAELLTNNDFRNGATGYQTSANWSLSVADGVMRIKRLTYGVEVDIVQSSSPSVVQYAPYVGRIMFTGGSNISRTNGGLYLSSSASASQDVAVPATTGLKSSMLVADGTTAALYFYDSSAASSMANDTLDVSWMSLSRCLLADGAPNALTYSDQINNAAWSTNKITVSANSHTAPDGTTTADGIIEDSTTGQHYFSQSASRTSQAEDLCAYGVFATIASSRDVRLAVLADGSNYSTCIFNLTAGTAGTPSNVGTMTSGRASIVSLGNGWYFCSLVARAPATATMSVEADMVNAGSVSYLGNGTGRIGAWRVGVARGGVPTRGAQTTSAATSGTSQTGATIYVKGLPASTNGLLLAGDLFEVNGELMQAVASLDSDAAGLGVLQMNRAPMTPIADNTPIIVNNPFGRFRLASDPRIVERFGVYTDVDLQLIEATA